MSKHDEEITLRIKQQEVDMSTDLVTVHTKYVTADFAHQLGRELAAAQAEVERLVMGSSETEQALHTALEVNARQRKCVEALIDRIDKGSNYADELDAARQSIAGKGEGRGMSRYKTPAGNDPRIYCKYGGAKLRRDSCGQYCPTRNCQWQHGLPYAEDSKRTRPTTGEGKEVKHDRIKTAI